MANHLHSSSSSTNSTSPPRQDGGGHLTRHAHLVTAQQRTEYIKQQGSVLWLTGLSGSGKSTLAMACEHQLLQQGQVAFVLDGDHTRGGLCQDLGFSLDDRQENVRRVAHCAHLMAQAGVITFVCLISPTQASRDMARSICHATPFYEVYLNVDLALCEQRDPKGLYRKARQGIITNFTGISSPYEVPTQAEIVIESEWSLQQSTHHPVQQLMK